MANLWQTALFQPLVNGLVFLYQFLFQNLGLAIIALTVLVRLVLLPITLPGMKSAAKMKELAPELEKLKKKYKGKSKELAQAQMALYKKHGANPTAGCLPTIVQFAVLIALYRAFYQVLQANGDIAGKLNGLLYPSLQLPTDAAINVRFLHLDLTQPDVLHVNWLPFPLPGVFLIGAALVQFLTSKLLAPATKKSEQVAKETTEKSDDLATTMQSQMLYLFPLMTLLIGFSFPSGLVLYWFAFSILNFGQQLLANKKAGQKND